MKAVGLTKRPLQILGLVAVAAAAPRSAEGCSVCVTALADYFVPPIAVWSLFCVIWFLTTASIASGTTRTLRFVPSIGRALLATLVAVLLGAALLGPIPLILLGVPPATLRPRWQ